MASRRTRIKGIANIPQRRKNAEDIPIKIEKCDTLIDTDSNILKTATDIRKEALENTQNVISPKDNNQQTDEITTEVNPEKDAQKISKSIDNTELPRTVLEDSTMKEIKTQPDAQNIEKSMDVPEVLSETCTVNVINSQQDAQNITDSKKTTKYQREVPDTCNVKAIKGQHDSQTVTKCMDNTVVSGAVPETGSVKVIKRQPILQKRKFIKPSVSLSSALIRKSNASGEMKNMVKEEKHTNSMDEIVEEKLQYIPIPISIQQTVTNEITLNEVNLLNNNDVIINTINETDGIQGQPERKPPVTILNCNQLSDTEYPPPPPSPNKINRSRIKAVPRLGYRKTSFSASESEDESRRNSHRIRNDSVCSTTSGVTDTMMETMSPQRPKEVGALHQKKIMRSEQTRKLAEARREFQRRFGCSKPDRQRLTMMDLIFYNPDTNPMEKTPDMKSKPNDVEEIPDDTADTEESEQGPESEKVDDENEMPVPQIKIGPSGEIILDEKSLVIERKGVKRQREEIQKSTLVDGDFDSSYGVYKKHKKIKNWSNEETVRFYRALSTLGTDFALMCELFPSRNRRELKKKFKKEERTNRILVDKALMQPCQYAFDELKLEMEREEKVQQEKQRQKEEDSRLRNERLDIARKKREEKQQERHKQQIVEAPAPKKKKIKKPKQLTIESLLDNNSDADVSDVETLSETEQKVVLSQKPTRSGRMPKARQNFESELPVRKKKDKKAENVEKKEEKNLPGSIMIVNEKGPNDEPIYKIFMVTPESTTNMPFKKGNDTVQLEKGVRAENILTISAAPTDDEEDDDNIIEPPPIENNMTIAEDVNVTSLKTAMDNKTKVDGNENKMATAEDVSCSKTSAAAMVAANDNTEGDKEDEYVTAIDLSKRKSANTHDSSAIKKSVIVISDQIIVPGHTDYIRDKI